MGPKNGNIPFFDLLLVFQKISTLLLISVRWLNLQGILKLQFGSLKNTDITSTPKYHEYCHSHIAKLMKT